jgi:ATP-binding cassette subfamily B protein
MPPYKGLRLYRRVLAEATPYWRHMGLLCALSLLSTLLALLMPLPLKIAIDSLIEEQPVPGVAAALLPSQLTDSETGIILLAAGLVLALGLLKQLQQFGTSLLTTSVSERVLLDFRTRLFNHAERLSLAYHDSAGAADSAYRIQYDAAAIPTLAVSGVIPFITAIVTVTAMIFVTAQIDWELALVSLAVAPILFIALRVYRGRLRAHWHDAKRLDSSALAVVHESLQALRVVKTFGREEHARDRFVEHAAAGVAAKIRVAVIEGRFAVVVGATIGLGTAAMLFLGARHVHSGTLTVGELVLVMGYLQQLYEPLKTASKKAGALQGSLASAERVYSLLDHQPDFSDPPDARSLDRATGSLTLQNVSFSYEPNREVIRDVSVHLEPATRLAIAGATGAGKTTLVSLLTRLYEPTSGTIRLDGVDLREYKLSDIRRQFAFVLQEPILFSTSVMENIAYARPDASPSDIVAAAKAASAHDFIQTLPDGYDTRVGERGVRLSGGERQRIALARAFLRDAPILVLDEPTSSIDPATESTIFAAMTKLMHGRTTLIITHRRSALSLCDVYLELDHGSVISVSRGGGRAPGIGLVP